MKRITCFTESLGGGGAEHQMVLLAGMLADKGYDVSIVTYASLPDHYNTPVGVRRIDIGATKVKGRRIKALTKAIKVFHYFLWLKTDCIVAYRECANLRVLLPMLFRSRKIKVICSDRNTSIRSSFQQKILFHLLYKRADYIVPNSITQTEYIARRAPKLIKKLRTIQNYTDLRQFCISSLPDDFSLIKVAIFSRYSSQKNPIGFANAMKQLKEKTKQSFVVHWYGEQRGNLDGYNADYINFKKYVEENGIGDVLQLKPSAKNPSVLMGEYHAVCLPSLYEGFSNSVAEGICCAKPMLVSDVSDNSMMVYDGENGYLFIPTQPESICDAFLNFFSLSYDEIVKMSIASRRIAEGLFNKNKFIQQYIDLIEA